ASDHQHDIALLCGVLYHLTEPVRLLEQLTARCRHLYLWTVFYDPAFCAEHPDYAAKFSAHTTAEHAGFAHHLHRWDYGASLDWQGFCGGPAPHRQWRERDEILGALAHFGFTRQAI